MFNLLYCFTLSVWFKILVEVLAHASEHTQKKSGHVLKRLNGPEKKTSHICTLGGLKLTTLEINWKGIPGFFWCKHLLLHHQNKILLKLFHFFIIINKLQLLLFFNFLNLFSLHSNYLPNDLSPCPKAFEIYDSLSWKLNFQVFAQNG